MRRGPVCETLSFSIVEFPILFGKRTISAETLLVRGRLWQSIRSV
jgi:hypothetical protein